MSYALTERRALIVRGSNLTVVDLARVSTVNLRGGQNGGRGTIAFGFDDGGFGGWRYGGGFDPWMPSYSRAPQFLGIERAQDVFNKIEATRSAQTAS